MGRYTGTVHKLIDNASGHGGNNPAKWNQVLHYLEGHTVGNGKTPNPNFDSPLPPYTSPSVELELELFDQQGPKREDTPLKLAIKFAPANVVAALCHLGPEAAKIADSRERLPIHWACRRSSEDPETEEVIKILALCYPQSLTHRDDGGRTPLHWLFWYHSSTRSTNIVKFMCQKLPYTFIKNIKQPNSPTTSSNGQSPIAANNTEEEYPLPQIPIPKGTEIPCCAAIIPDARHGNLPLHYAVIQGASKEAIKLLVQEYPSSLAFGDRKGRTALAWYLGAGYLLDDKKHVCGETNDPNATPWCYAKLSTAIIQLLLTSKVAREVDNLGRTPLHWACDFFVRSTHALDSSGLSIKSIQMIVDSNVSAVTARDCHQKTPLHTFFDTMAELQQNDYKRMVSNHTMRDNIDLVKGGPTAFRPPRELIELLLKSPEVDGQDGIRFDPGRDERKASAAYAEDKSALLPLHTALYTASSPEIIRLLVKYNPTSLVHTSEELLQSPLVHAFISPYTAPLQSSVTFQLLMEAYVTSRHGTFMDGRLALKMEDSTGKYPIHYACQNQACVETIKLFIEKFPRCALLQNGDGDLPLFCLLSNDHLFAAPSNGTGIQGASLAHTMGMFTEKEIEWQKKVLETNKEKIRALVNPLVASPEHLKIKSSSHGLTPLHVAVAFDALPYGTVYQMLKAYPDAMRFNSTVPGYEFSALDLHELHRNQSEDIEEWQAIREVLFAFYPLLASHRKKEDILEACVNLILHEAKGLGTYHLTQQDENEKEEHPGIEISETLSTIQAPEIDCAYRPKTPRTQTPRTKQTPTNLKKKNRVTPVSPNRALPATGSYLPNTFSFSTNKKEPPKVEKKSIYDDDMNGVYVLTPPSSRDEEDDEEICLSSEEEYFSDEDSDSDSVGESHTESSVGQDIIRRTPSGTSTRTDRSSLRHKKKGPLSPHYIEEKKEESSMKEESPEKTPEFTFTRLSDIAMRLWCFFVLHNDPKNPSDNYLQQVESITEDLPYDVVTKLFGFAVPDYAEEYLDQGTSTDGVTLVDVASPSVKALYDSLSFFLGQYEFSTEKDGVLLHRSIDKNTVLIRATRHIVRTQEYQPAEQLLPGTAEEAIWNTGEQIMEEGAYMASRYSDMKKNVYFKLTRNQGAYQNEVLCRQALGLVPGDLTPTNIVPLLDSLCATADSRKDKRYKLDVNDERFKTLSLSGGETVCLSDYPYALIYPYCDDGDLFDFFYHHGLDSIEEVAEIGRQVGRALKKIHERGVIHGSLSLRSVAMLPFTSDDQDSSDGRLWALSDLSGASRQLSASFMGGISHDGSAQFQTGLMAPEMFVKLSAREVRTYTTYWEMVEKIYDVKVDGRVVEPFVNLETGSTYVLRLHYIPASDDSRDVSQLPNLPYELLHARESTDLWCFGLLLFTLCSGGRPLFPANFKTGHLLGSEAIVRWDQKMASASIYEHVEDPIAQDLLLHLLAPFDERNALSMETVLNHPFFNTRNNGNSALLGKMINHRQQESAVHDRWRQNMVNEKSEVEWLQSRTTEVKCWNFDMLKKFHFSSSELVRSAVGREHNIPPMPCGIVLLPYKLSAKNKKAKLAPTTKKDVERAERMGILLLSLAKACQFVVRVEETIAEYEGISWTAISLIKAVVLPDGDFESLKSDLIKHAAENIEAFRTNPVSVIRLLVADQYMAMKKFFKAAGKAYLYLVDEHSGIPLVGASYAPYPLAVSDASTLARLFPKMLPFMHACTIYARGLSGNVSGLVRLIFEAAYPHIPPSWADEAKGVTHVLKQEAIVKEISVLHAIITSSSSESSSLYDNLRYIRETIARADTNASFADMCRVECAGYALWTTKEGAGDIQEACQDFEFKDALDIQAALESQLKAQERQIKLLREEVDRLKFRKELKLEVPLNTPSASETQSLRNTRSIPVLTPPVGRNLIPSPGNAQNASSQSVPVMMTPSAGRNLRPSSAMNSTTGSLIPSPSNTGDAGKSFDFDRMPTTSASPSVRPTTTPSAGPSPAMASNAGGSLIPSPSNTGNAEKSFGFDHSSSGRPLTIPSLGKGKPPTPSVGPSSPKKGKGPPTGRIIKIHSNSPAMSDNVGSLIPSPSKKGDVSPSPSKTGDVSKKTFKFDDVSTGRPSPKKGKGSASPAMTSNAGNLIPSPSATPTGDAGMKTFGFDDMPSSPSVKKSSESTPGNKENGLEVE